MRTDRHRRRILVTATPPTPNGDLHLGHLSGPYLGADIYTRYCRLRGDDVRYISGSDDHQSYTDVKARQTGSTAALVADHFGDAIVETLAAARIEVDFFARPRRSPRHIHLVQDVFSRMYAAGHLVAKEAKTLYCDSCHQWLFEAYVTGQCPHCGAPSGGNACEDCGRPNDCVDLKAPVCKLCGTLASQRTLRRLYFPLSRHEAVLRRFHAAAGMDAHLGALCARMMADGLPDIAVSHPSSWGIPVPVEGFEGQCIYVWFEMAPGYIAAVQDLLEAEGHTASAGRITEAADVEVVQYFGFDNGYFHALLFPAIIHALDPRIPLARTFVVNEFYRLDGQKFSTSRMHAIWGRDLIGRTGADAVRFFLAHTSPERRRSNFSMHDFEITVCRELTEGWQAWLCELDAQINEECAARRAPGWALPTSQCRQFAETLSALGRAVGEAYDAESFSPQRATRLLCEIARIAMRHSDSELHWRGVRGSAAHRAAAIALQLAAARTLAATAAPLMPDFARVLAQRLGCESDVDAGGWSDEVRPVPEGQHIGELGVDFLAGAALPALSA